MERKLEERANQIACLFQRETISLLEFDKCNGNLVPNCGRVSLMITGLSSVSSCPGSNPSASDPFLESPGNISGPQRHIFSSSVSKNNLYRTPETSCIKRTSVDIKNT